MFRKLILVSLFLHVLATPFSPTAKQFPNWIFHIGMREAPKELTSRLNNQSSTNCDGISVLNSVLIPAAKQQDISKNQKPSGLPLVDLGGRFYYFGTYFKANFFKAMQFCRDHGMNLLSIESNDENTRILNHLPTYVKTIDHFWTSGADLGEEGKFVWLATGKYLNYTYWSPPQPDNAGNVEDCLEIWKLGDKHYVWNDVPCTNEFNFICEMKECTDFCL